MRLAMSESDLYRKQRIAIEEVAHHIAEMEREAYQPSTHDPAAASMESQPHVSPAANKTL
jgi:hypothetical protein